jgi:hypothetical protein
MGYLPYVGFATHRRATVRIHLYFKRLIIKKMIYIKKKKWVVTAALLIDCPTWTSIFVRVLAVGM